MKPFHQFFSFVALSLVVGCAPVRTPSSTDSADDQKFRAIVRFYRETCPTTKFDGHNVHLTDGPHGERLHISVPVAVQADYVHPFSTAFLEQQSQSSDGLVRMVAEDLSYLRCKLLFKRDGARVSYGGESFDCVDYVVQRDSPPHR